LKETTYVFGFCQHVHCSQHWNFNGPRDGCLSLGLLATAGESGTDDSVTSCQNGPERGRSEPSTSGGGYSPELAAARSGSEESTRRACHCSLLIQCASICIVGEWHSARPGDPSGSKINLCEQLSISAVGPRRRLPICTSCGRQLGGFVGGRFRMRNQINIDEALSRAIIREIGAGISQRR